jgi:hypothetical protein
MYALIMPEQAPASSRCQVAGFLREEMLRAEG